MTIKKYRSKQQIEVWQFDGIQKNIPKWLKDKAKFLMMENGTTGIYNPCLYFGCYYYEGHYFIYYLDNNNIETIYEDEIQAFLKDFEAIK